MLLQMREELWLVLPPIIHAVDIRDWNLREFRFGDTFETADVDSVHLADRSLVADAESADTTPFAEEVLILLGVEEILGKLFLARNQAKSFRSGNSGPEAIPAANGAVAAIRTLRKVEIRLEPHRAAVAAALVGFQHVTSSTDRSCAANVPLIRAPLVAARRG
jgi:hypothetical protein